MENTIQFSVGQKVRCIADKFDFNSSWMPKEYHDITLPKKGKYYTVRDVVITDFGVGLRLLEIVNPVIHHDIGGDREPIFGTNRFLIVNE